MIQIVDLFSVANYFWQKSPFQNCKRVFVIQVFWRSDARKQKQQRQNPGDGE